MSDSSSPKEVSPADGEGALFLVRWRGRQEGPYLASVIESKLAANEIGLLHEIFYDGKWVTIRDYTTEREAILRAELQAQEEQKQRAREEAERQTRVREEQNRAAALVEERRKNDLLAAGLERQSNASHAQAAPQIALKPTQGRPNSHPRIDRSFYLWPFMFNGLGYGQWRSA